MMRVIILTLILYLTDAFFCKNSNETSLLLNYDDEPFYNIHEWVTKLNLQRCSFVEIGLKYFAIFVEDEVLDDNGIGKHYFLGTCNLNTLMEWNFCSPELFFKHKSKCTLKLRRKQFHLRVHRRFCDIQIMINNKDCICTPTIFGESLYKVVGFPTCYISPSQGSLCRYYNVCGLSQCKTTTVEGRVYAVECNPNCKGRQPFCEYPIGARTSLFPRVTSFWSEWREVRCSESHKMHSVATCINKYTREGAVDCLGPGTSCCPTNIANCSCTTYIENGVLKLNRVIYDLSLKTNLDSDYDKYLEKILDKALKIQHKNITRKIRDNTDEEDIDDDDDESDDINDDIAIEESEDEEPPVPTTEQPEIEEIIQELNEEVVKPKNFSDPNDQENSNNTINLERSNKCSNNYNSASILCLILTSVTILIKVK